MNIGNSIIGILTIPGFFSWSLQSKSFLDYREIFDYRDFSGKIPIFEVTKCFVVNLKIQLSGFFEIFRHPRLVPIFKDLLYTIRTLVIKNSVRSTRLESDESILPIFDEDGEVVLEAVEDLDEEKDDEHRRIMV